MTIKTKDMVRLLFNENTQELMFVYVATECKICRQHEEEASQGFQKLCLFENVKKGEIIKDFIFLQIQRRGKLTFDDAQLLIMDLKDVLRYIEKNNIKYFELLE